jgi:uncharacterized membrane protein
LSRKLLVVAPVAAAALLVISSGAALAAGPGVSLYGRMGPVGFFPFGLLRGFAGLLLLAGFVLLIVWLIRALAGPSSWRQAHTASAAAAPQSPLDILARRFAAGEISAEEFQKARDVLGEAPKP